MTTVLKTVAHLQLFGPAVLAQSGGLSSQAGIGAVGVSPMKTMMYAKVLKSFLRPRQQ
jgi:hypothetical protein